MTNGADGTQPPEPEDIQTGEPVTELATLTTPMRAGFFSRLNRRIDRRTLTNNALTASWHFPIMIILEFLVMTFELLGIGKRDDKGGHR